MSIHVIGQSFPALQPAEEARQNVPISRMHEGMGSICLVGCGAISLTGIIFVVGLILWSCGAAQANAGMAIAGKVLFGTGLTVQVAAIAFALRTCYVLVT